MNFSSSTDNIDESLKKCDTQEPFIPPESPAQEKLPAIQPQMNMTEKLVEEFGGHIMKNGKHLTKKQPKSYADLINDKSHVNELRDRYKQYSLVSGKNDVDDDNEYDDEYDDSYDVYADTEPRIHLRGNMRDALPDDIDSDESKSEEEQPPVRPEQIDRVKRNPMDFCENPEIIRERREQGYQNRLAKRMPQRASTGGKTRDVVGATKGQGQNNEVLRNRQQKGVNKSSRANHSRKAGSTFKQSRGMF